jgi:hypothetical protein
MVGRPGLQGGHKPGQHVIQGAAMDGQARGLEGLDQPIVAGLDAGRHHDLVDAPRPGRPLDLAQQHGRPGQRQQHLARQTG